MKTQDIIKLVNEAIKEIFREIPAGFKEYIYEEALCYELEKRNIKFYRQKRLPFVYKNNYLCSYVPDLLIPTEDGDYVLELKHKENLYKRDTIQLKKYLFAMDESHGSLVNFQNRKIVDYELIKKDNQQENVSESKISKSDVIIECIKNFQKEKSFPEDTWIKCTQIIKLVPNIAEGTVKTLLRKLTKNKTLRYEKAKGYQTKECDLEIYGEISD